MPAGVDDKTDAGLLRAVGSAVLTLSVVNVIIGGGIFMMPGALAATLGPASALAPLLGALVIVPIALCFAAAGSRVIATGGPFAYTQAAFGPFAGFATGALMWISNVASSAGVAAALAGQLAQLVPALAPPLPRALLLIGIYTLLTAVNLRGVVLGSRAIAVLAVLKLLPLVVLALVGLAWVDWSQIELTTVPPTAALGASMVLVMFAYSGMETALTPSGEVRSASRSVPLATLTAIAGVVVLYFLLQVVGTGVLGAAALASAPAPLAAVAGAIWAPGLVLLLLTAGVSMLGFLQGNLLGTSRLVYALARDGFLPAPLARIQPRTQVPAAAVILHAALALTLALAGSFGKLALISGGAICLMYLVCCAAAWKLQSAGVRGEHPPFKLPLGGLVPVLACALLAWVLTTLKPDEWAAIGVAFAAIVVSYAVVRGLRQTRNR